MKSLVRGRGESLRLLTAAPRILTARATPVNANSPLTLTQRFSSANNRPSPRDVARQVLHQNKAKLEAETAAASKATVNESGAGGSDASHVFSFAWKAGLATALVGGLGWMALSEQGNAFAKKNILSEESSIGQALTRAQELVMMPFKDFTEPSRDRLLPDMPPIPPGHVAHRTLILDLEGTLCHSQWDRQFGWRTAKRPGIDAFLAKMAQMYEIVIFSSGTFINDQPIIMQLDQYHFTAHHLYRDATLFKDGKHIKDLSKINRDLSRVIMIEDKPEELELNRENVVKIKAFDDVSKFDNELEKLGNFLEDLFYRDVKDVREELKRYHSDNILDEFIQMKQQHVKQEQQQRQKGLGGFIRRHM